MICIISDIHGNIYATKQLIKTIKKLKIEMIIFAGDLCGYYYYPQECLEELMSLNTKIFSILGNHDKMFLDLIAGKLEIEFLVKKFGNAYRRLLDSDHSDLVSFLERNGTCYKTSLFSIFHGSPNDHLNEYIYKNTKVIEQNWNVDTPIIILGHTHYPMVRKLSKFKLINPGSIGQPRDCSFLSFAILDPDTIQVKIHRLQYDISKLLKDIEKFDPYNSYLKNVLFR